MTEFDIIRCFNHNMIKLEEMILTCRWFVFAFFASRISETHQSGIELRCIFQILIVLVSLSNNMQICVLGGGVDTLSDHHPQGPGFKSRGCLILLCLFQIQQDMIPMTSFWGSASSHRVTQIPNGLRKNQTGCATRDSSLPFTSHHSTEQE